ncbi:MAG: hypothetical protein IKW04_05015 [Clostridia bacterium]|nr:hypothetical protein [Clostridia bacterium]
MKKNIFDFSGGYNDTVYNLNLKDNEFSEFYNVDPLPQGGFKVRNGCKKLNKVPFPGTITQMIEWKLRNGATKTIVVSERKLYVFSSVSGEWEPVKTKDGEFELENDTVSYTFFRDFLYFSDGLKMYRWNDEVFYLSNLDEYEHHFKAGDIIKLTASRQESLFRGEEGVIMDVRNLMRPKFTYAWKQYVNEDNHYVYQNVYKVKYKFVNTPAGEYEASEGDLHNEPDGIYALHYSSFIDEGAPGAVQDGYFTDMKMEMYPFYDTFYYGETDRLDAPKESEIYFMESAAGWARKTYAYGAVHFDYVGSVGEYYQFQEDATEFYPHNYNYRTNTAYLGKRASLRKLDEELVDNIMEVEEFPVKIAACKYFCFYAKRQRFLASGNPEDPTAIYVSKLGTFEEWDDYVTIYPDCHLGAVTGIYPMNDDILVCFENGFSYVDSELLLADGSEVVVEYIPKMSSVPVGVANGDTFCQIPQGVIFYHGENIFLASYSLFGKNYVKMPSQSEFVCLSQNKCENILKGSTKHRAVYHDHKYYLYFTDVETKDRILIYDFVYGNFRLYGDIEISAFVSKEKDNTLLISSGKDVLAAFSEGVYLDGDHQPISFAIRSKYYDIGYDFRRLQLNRLYLVKNIYTENEERNILISLLGDSTEQEIKDTLSDGVLWKNSSWDGRYSWNQDFVIHAFNLNFRTNRIGFYITNCEDDVINSPIVFYSLSFHYDKLGEDTTKFRHELETGEEPVFLNWDDQR